MKPNVHLAVTLTACVRSLTICGNVALNHYFCQDNLMKVPIRSGARCGKLPRGHQDAPFARFFWSEGAMADSELTCGG